MELSDIRKSLFGKFSIFTFLLFTTMTILLFLPFENLYSFDLKLVWEGTGQEDVAGYKIFCREAGRRYIYNQPVWEGSGTNCIISGLEKNKAYFFVARSFNILGIDSYNSNEVYTINISEEIHDCIIDLTGIDQNLQNDNDGKDPIIILRKYNLCTGSWIFNYQFFGKHCGKDIPL